MMTHRHVTPLGRAGIGELLGPAEGQYQTVFQDTLETNSGPAQAPCYDIWEFSLTETTEDVCIGMSVGGPLPAGSIGFEVWSWGTCAWSPFEEIDAGMSDASTCLADLPAGDYAIFVSGAGLDPLPQPYTLTIDASAESVADGHQEFDETCGTTPVCVGNGPSYER